MVSAGNFSIKAAGDAVLSYFAEGIGALLVAPLGCTSSDSPTSDKLECEADGDGEKSIACGGKDCDDHNSKINSSAYELPGDEIDENCNGMQDADADLDFYSTEEGDCNDHDRSIHPGAYELCNNLDDDCDGATDEDCNANATLVGCGDRGGSEKLQDAIDNAHDGDTLMLCGNRFTESVTIRDKKLTIASQNPVRKADIAGMSNPGPVMTLEHASAVLRGLHISWGTSEKPYGRIGHGISFKGELEDFLTLEDCFVVGNQGDGINARGGKEIKLTNTELGANLGFGLYVSSVASVVIDGSKIRFNSYPGAHIDNCPDVRFTSSSITANGVPGLFVTGNRQVDEHGFPVSRLILSGTQINGNYLSRQLGPYTTTNYEDPTVTGECPKPGALFIGGLVASITGNSLLWLNDHNASQVSAIEVCDEYGATGLSFDEPTVDDLPLAGYTVSTREFMDGAGLSGPIASLAFNFARRPRENAACDGNLIRFDVSHPVSVLSFLGRSIFGWNCNEGILVKGEVYHPAQIGENIFCTSEGCKKVE